jgi:hypothetical protein
LILGIAIAVAMDTSVITIIISMSVNADRAFRAARLGIWLLRIAASYVLAC